MNRNHIAPIFLLCIFNIIRNDVMAARLSKTCNDIESKSTVLQLKRHLLCDYDNDVRPIKNNNNVTRVTLHIRPQFFLYTNEDLMFELHTWTAMNWNDMHLKWDPAQFDDIQSIFVSAYDIWIPDILPHNEQTEETTATSYAQTKCWVWKKGLVQWFKPTKYSTYCTADNTWWPYNLANCTIQFGSWSHSGEEIDLVADNNFAFEIELYPFRKNVEWDLLKVEVTKQIVKHKYNLDSTAKMISYHFILRRHWGIIQSAYITPSIVLMVMTLTTLWLEPKSFERMMIANLNFICHIICIHDVHWEIPKSGFHTPKLLIVYDSSLAIASFVLILTTILRHLQEMKTEPPLWISTITTSILRSRIGQILLVSILDPTVTAKIEFDADDNTDLVQSNSKKMPWRYVTVIIGWLAFLSIFLTYIVLLSTCLPIYFPVNL